MKRQRQTELPRFVLGALAAAGAATQANAATVQITFNGSFISSNDGNQLDGDFGDDGGADLAGVGGGFSATVYALPGKFTAGRAVGYTQFTYVFVAAVRVGKDGGLFQSLGPASASLRAFATITFQDANIRGGAATTGYLDMSAFSDLPGEQRVTVHRLIFDDATGGAIGGLDVNDPAFPEFSAIPEPSSLGLLALGAGGLLLRRRRAAAHPSRRAKPDR